LHSIEQKTVCREPYGGRALLAFRSATGDAPIHSLRTTVNVA